MAQTHIQQHQISGSLVIDISDNVERNNLVKAGRTIVDDLNSLRSQVKSILGSAAWTDEQAITLQNIKAQLTGSLIANDAEFAGAISVAGESTFASATVSDLTQSRVVLAGASGALVDDAALTFSSNTLVVGSADGTNSATINPSEIRLTDAFGNNFTILGQSFLGLGGPGSNGSGLDGTLEVKNSDNSAVFIVNSRTADGPMLEVGAGTNPGNIKVRGADNVSAIELHGLTASATFGAEFVDGSVSVKNANNVEKIKLDGSDGSLTVAGNSDLNGALDVAGQVDLAAAGVATSVRGTLSVAEEATFASAIVSDLTESRVVFAGTSGALVDHESLTFVADPTAYRSTLAVGGTDRGGIVSISDSADVEAIKLDGAGGSLELIYDNQSRFYADSMGMVQLRDSSGSTKITLNGSAGSVLAEKISIANDTAQRLYIVDSDGSMKDEEYLTFDGATLAIDGFLSVSSNADLNGTLDVAGQVDLAAAGVATSVRGTLAVAEDATFAGNVQVDGDLRVKGSMTYIDTVNVRVEDAFIYLATGSLGTTDSGIVLHGGAGVGMDLAIAQKGGSGEFIFGKGDRQPDGEGSLVGMELVPAKFAGIKLGSAEDALSGSMSISGDNIKVAASAAALVLDDAYRAGSSYSGDFKLAASSAEWTMFQNQYPGKSLLGALGAGGGVGVNFRKKIIMGSNANFSGNTLDIAAAGIGSLRSTAQVDSDYGLDVYLNGVLLALGGDYTVPSTSTISFNYAINSDDVLTIVAKNIA